MFNKHFKEWWTTGELVTSSNPESIAAFGKLQGKLIPSTTNRVSRKIECVCALAVSPAAAGKSYSQKRESWEQYCYAPGIEDYKNNFN